MMLQYLDTAIAFVVILLGMSLLITILNQMISTFLGYRGTNLLWGIRTLLKTLDPTLEEKAEEIATDVLKKPMITDSLFSEFSGIANKIPPLGWFMKRWKLATALTPEELVRSLSHVAQAMTPIDKDDKTGKSINAVLAKVDPETAKSIKAVLVNGDPETAKSFNEVLAKVDERTKQSINKLLDKDLVTARSINALLAQVDPEAARNAKMVLDTLQELSPNTKAQMDKLVQELGTSMQASIGKVESYFDAIMKRTSQRFTTQMRIWTIVFAVLLAFGAQFDTIETLNKLWASPELRASLVSDRDTILKEAAVVLSVQSGTAQVTGQGVSPTILRSAMKTLQDIEKEATAGLGAPPEFANLDAALGWLQQNLKVDEGVKKKLADNYRNLVLAGLSAQAEKIGQELAKSGFKLEIMLPWEAFKGPLYWPKVLGILITAGLLSLGAPFWFNILRSISNLRPLIANMPVKTGTGSAQT